MKRKYWLIWVLVILLTLSMLTGCDNYDDLLTPLRKNVQDVNDGMISGVRTGILRQGITNHYKTSECSEEANWFFADIGGQPILYRLEQTTRCWNLYVRFRAAVTTIPTAMPFIPAVETSACMKEACMYPPEKSSIR